MSTERKPEKPLSVQVIEALKKYQELLNFYGIKPEIQEIVLSKIQQQPPWQIIEEIENYWQEHLKNNQSCNPKDQRREQNLTLLPPSERTKYLNNLKLKNRPK